MCVAVVVPAAASWPKPEQLIQMEEANRHGGGIAWVEKGKVCWKKGIKAVEMIKLIEKIKPPALIHFRIATTGGDLPELCHPFPISADVSLALEGAVDSALIHNGHWDPWKQQLMHMAPAYCLNGRKFPKRPWSDTRGIALVAAMYGEEILTWIDEKVAVLRKDGTFEKFGSPWTESEGCFYSNMGWEHKWTKKDEKNFRQSWDKGDVEVQTYGEYSCYVSKTAAKDSDNKSSEPSRSVYLSEEQEKANEAIAILIKKTDDPKVVALALVNELQIVNG